MKVSKEAIINKGLEIMEKFRFDKVHALMLISRWEWAGSGVPR